MTDKPEPVLSAAEAKKRFAIYLAVKLLGLGLLIGGLFLARAGLGLGNGAMLVLGVVSLFFRPKWLGLTTRPEK
jgi:hypothetical protein